MPSREKKDLETLRAAIAQFPDGASLEEIRVSAGLPVSDRPLIRRLGKLVEHGVARRRASLRAARYVLVDTTKPVAAVPAPAPRDMFVPVGQRGTEILRLVTRPISVRQPVGYNREFLSSYKPNRSSYLSPAEKVRL